NDNRPNTTSPTLPPLKMNERKSAHAITPYTEKNYPQNEEYRPEENHKTTTSTTSAKPLTGREKKVAFSPIRMVTV
ncbi:TPA: hypothetical protein ACNI1Y_005432, partial [Klebsiella pneumoniae]